MRCEAWATVCFNFCTSGTDDADHIFVPFSDSSKNKNPAESGESSSNSAGSTALRLVEAMGVEQCHFIPFEKQPFDFSRIHADFQRQHSMQIASFLCTGFNSGLQNGFVAQDFLQLILKLPRGLFFLALQQVRIHAVGVHLARVPHQRLHGSFRERFCQ